jgi:hypothetical protein
MDLSYEIFTKLARFGHRNYDRYLSTQLDLESGYQAEITNLLDSSTFSEGFSDWSTNIIFESVAKDRELINKMVADYLYRDLRVISKGAMGDFQNLRANYFYQSFYSTYLHLRVSVGFSRFVVKGKAKLGNFASDLLGVIKHLAFIHTDDDIRAVHAPESKRHAAIFERLYRRKQKFLDRIKAIFRIFPSMRPSGIYQLYGLFVAGAYVYTRYYAWPLEMRTLLDARDAAFRPKEGDELWSFFMDCGVFILYWLLTWL